MAAAPSTSNLLQVSVTSSTAADGNYSADFRATMSPATATSTHVPNACPYTHKPFVWLWPTSQRKSYCSGCGDVVSAGALDSKFSLIPKGMHLCPRCVSYEIPRICGLQECDWFHGCLSSEEAERRLKRDDSALGDFLIRLSHNEEHGGNHFVLSCRSSPSKVTHVVLIGEAGSWGLSFAKTFQTIQELITETMKGDAIDRAAIADRETVHGSCPSCTMAMANNADLFCCNCGARVRSTEAAIDHYDRVGREYMSAEFTA